MEAKTAARHDGTAAGTYYARRAGATWGLRVSSTEAIHFASVMQRLKQAVPGLVSIDYTTTSWGWTAARWIGPRPMALYDPSAVVDLASWLTAPWYGLRAVQLDMVEVP